MRMRFTSMLVPFPCWTSAQATVFTTSQLSEFSLRRGTQDSSSLTLPPTKFCWESWKSDTSQATKLIIVALSLTRKLLPEPSSEPLEWQGVEEILMVYSPSSSPVNFPSTETGAVEEF